MKVKRSDILFSLPLGIDFQSRILMIPCGSEIPIPSSDFFRQKKKKKKTIQKEGIGVSCFRFNKFRVVYISSSLTPLLSCVCLKNREWIWVFSLSRLNGAPTITAANPLLLSLPLYIQHLDSIYNKHIPHRNHICLVCQPSRDYITSLYCVSTSTAPPPHCCVNLKPPSGKGGTRLRGEILKGGKKKKNVHIFREGHENICYLVITQLLAFVSFWRRKNGGIRTCLSEFSRIFFSSFLPFCFIFWPRRRKATLRRR